MQRLEVSGAVRPIYGSLGVKRLMIISHSVLLTMGNVSAKFVEKIARFMFENFFSFSKIVPFIRQCVKNFVEPDRQQIACWIPKSTNTHIKYAIFIAFTNKTMVA